MFRLTETLNKLRIKMPLHYFIVSGIGITGIVLSFLVFSLVRTADEHEIQIKFQGEVEHRYLALKREIESDLLVLTSIQAFYLSSRNIDRSRFRAFTRHFLSRDPGIQALEWVPRVPGSQRGNYEKAAMRDGFHNFQITERIAQGKMATAGKRNEYFPAYFIEPIKGNEIALGFDLSSNPNRLAALKLSGKTGGTFASGRVTLVQETRKDQFGFIVFAPVYRHGVSLDSDNTRWDNLEGFVLGVFRISDIVERSLSYLKPAGIDFSIYDESAPETTKFLYFHPSRTRKPPLMGSLMGREKPDNDIRLRRAKTMDVAGRKWVMVFTATPDYIAAIESINPWRVLGAGLVFTILITGFLLVNIRRVQLSSEIAERKKAESRIKQSLLEKETLLREVHHRVKNNLAVVSSLLALQSKRIKDKTLRAMFEDSEQRIKTMALVHEKLYQTTDFSQIDLGDYVNTMVKELLSTFDIEGRQITTRIDIADIKLDLGQAIPCGMILNELLTNSFKYAFPGDRGGEIAISFTQSDGAFTLTIRDSGIGLPEGFDYKQTTTLGLQLVNVLAHQLRGTLQINSDGGTEAVLKFGAREDNDGKKEDTYS